MAKANGWNGCGMGVHGNGSSSVSIRSASKYSRSTELRRVEDNDIYRLAKILDENACWRKLMSIIPKGLDVQACSAAGGLNFSAAVRNGFKYSAQDVCQIDEAANRLPPDQSKSQMMIDEWKTSGKLHERPTVGVLLQLLVQAELFSAADFVALDFLSEPTPDRPADGPAAPISLDLSELLEEEMDVDNEGPGYQPPNTATSNAAAQGSVGLNLDNFDKHMVPRDKSVPQPSENVPPIAPPRASRLLRDSAGSRNAASTGATTSSTTVPNIPNLTILNPSEQIEEQRQQQPRQQNIPNLSILIASSEASMTTASTSLGNPSNRASSTDPPNIPRITLLIDNSAEISSPPVLEAAGRTATAASPAASTNNLPMISALNLNTDNGEHPDSSSSLSNDEDDDDDDDEVDGEGDFADVSLPNMSNSEQPNSNNDSSLTTVTGTSGDNSFELTNDSSSASNDDYAGNIPNLSELQH
ncbi:protein Tube [Drosophila kikkawai]|uniref:Protein Tube n=1 Tax=Drosophila kikkawai TaxID=30033 RepID=A0A6P4IDB3_DROKI|nr:protein Tube [Drosophila kikkawai]